MTPKEKAKELLKKYTSITLKEVAPGIFLAFDEELCKRFALIAVDEIIQSEPLEPNDTPDWLQPEDWFSDANIYAEKYWKEVKQEIEKL